MRARRILLTVALLLAGLPGPSLAGIADTPPQGIVVLESTFVRSEVDRRYGDGGRELDLADPVERFAPTGEFQGNLLIPGTHRVQAVVTRMAIGVTDEIALGVVVPYFVEQKTRLNLGWEPGDFIPEFDRVMTQDDFWDWAGGLGQPRPENWRGTSRLGDVILAALVNVVREPGIQVTALMFGNTFTGGEAPPEQLGSNGTSGFHLITNGDLGLHLLSDWSLPDHPWLDRFTFSLDLYYEFFLPRTRPTPRGLVHPLILLEAPFVGDSYEVDRGDIFGAAPSLSVDLVRGPRGTTWLTEKNPALQDAFPAVLSFRVRYNPFRTFDTRYTSESPVWDSEQEEDNRALYKNSITLGLNPSLLRVGVPVDLTAAYLSQTWLPGRAFRPTDAWQIGARLYYSVYLNPLDLILGD